MRWIYHLYGGCLLLALNACNDYKTQEIQNAPPVGTDTATAQHKPESAVVEGNYVSSDYYNRTKGYDWVGVQVRTNARNGIMVSVRSRADKKKPTCTMDAEAQAIGNGVYKATLPYGSILFTFSDTSLAITPETDKDEGALSFYCSGGATLKGTYKRIDGALDSTQVDKKKAK